MQSDKKISTKKQNIKASRQSEPCSPEQLWKKRLSCLSDEEQTHIAKKYYGGQYPWKG